MHLTLLKSGGAEGSDTYNINKLYKLIRKICSVIGWRQDSLEAVVERRTLNKLLSLKADPVNHTGQTAQQQAYTALLYVHVVIWNQHHLSIKNFLDLFIKFATSFI